LEVLEHAKNSLVYLTIQRSDGIGTCYGARISPTHTLTAAHCVFPVKDNPSLVNVFRIYPNRIGLFDTAKNIYIMDQSGDCPGRYTNSDVCPLRDLAIVETETPTKRF